MNICIVQTAFLGDLILTASFIETLSKTYPNSNISIVVKKGLENSFSNAFISKHKLLLIPYDKKKSQKSFVQTLIFTRQLRNFDLFFCLHNSFRSGLITFLAKSTIKIGFKQNPLSFLFNFSYIRDGIHEIFKNHKLLSFNKLIVSDPVLNNPYNLLADSFENIYGEYIVIAPGSQWATKKFNKYDLILNHILKNHTQNILFTGSLEDKEDIKTLIKNNNSNRIFDLSGLINIPTLISVIANAKLLLCNDSAPLHIATGTKTPLITFFGPTSKSLGYFPPLDSSFVFEINDLKCRPCGTHGHNKCPLKGAPLYCMNKIDIKSVYNKIDEYLKL